MDPLRNTRKRCRAVASALATVPVQPAVLEFDFMHPDRYRLQTGVVRLS